MKTIIHDSEGNAYWDTEVADVGGFYVQLSRTDVLGHEHLFLFRREEAEKLLAFIDLWLSEHEDAE